ncbi:unnamed protein product [Sphenostylis stenocarpa]|uniref:Protein kinase domain-containing protein n=1 Tax=Sphenostylis stenocarpa TaxID=92480 RepID=A0AA86VVK8_9FABA|nr:unnamed protein product [Sphenostylis stenocarpa]
MVVETFFFLDFSWSSIRLVLTQLHHPNPVPPVIGFCNEGNKFVLEYEYMTAGSLHDHIYHKRTKVASLLYKRKLQIYLCVERGLHYFLHTRVKYLIHSENM